MSSSISELVLSSPHLKARLGYPRFASEDLDVLVIDARYHLVGELRRALAQRGHRVWTLPVAPDAQDMVRTLLRALVEYRPDFVLTVNHHGFDEGGAVGDLLETLEIPVAAWYVDSPLFVLRGRPVPAAGVTALFTWERTLVPVFSAECQTVHLPLATDPDTFSGADVEGRGITFVGDSGRRAAAKWRDRLDPQTFESAETVADSLRDRNAQRFVRAEVRDTARAADHLAAAAWRGTSRWRTEVLSAFVEDGLEVYGDEGWADALPSARRHPEVPYGPSLARLYRESAVNLNVTSLQMPTAVNQRVFDVPAAGGFLLTDAQADLAELFAEDEIATWTCIEEAIDKSKYYVRHPERRQALVRRGQARVLAEHTYGHRADVLVDTLRRRFGRASHGQAS
ncbi:MAG: glycosyltransferase [Myxococcota bacterium]